ncbi:MAG: hypothetical protein AAFR51_14045 [Pseudomonadota bacterium]
MFKKKAVIVGVSLAFLVGCASGRPGSGPIAPKGAEPEGQLVTKLYIKDACSTGTRQNALGSALVGLLLKPFLESVVSKVGDGIRKAGEEQKTQVFAEKGTDFYEIDWAAGQQSSTKLGLNAGCLTVVHGTLATPPTDESKLRERFDAARKLLSETYDLPPRSRSTPLAEGDAHKYLTPNQTLDFATLEFSNDIRFFGEFAMERSDDRTAMRLIPQAVLIGKPFAPAKRFVSNKRDIVLTLSLHAPSQSGAADAFAVANIPFKNAKRNVFLSTEDLVGVASGWFPLAPVPESTSKRIDVWDKALKSIQDYETLVSDVQRQLDAGVGDDGKALTNESRATLVTLQRGANREITRLRNNNNPDKTPFGRTSPITVKTVLTETREGNQFLIDLGTYLSANKTEIAEPFFNALDPETRKTARAGEEDNEDTLRIAAIEAVAAYDEAQSKEGDERSESAIRVAEVKAEQACRKLKDAGYSDPDCLGF